MKLLQTTVILLALLIAAGLSLGSPVAGGSEPAVHEKILANGLKVLVRLDQRAPVVTSQIWYKVGSAHETSGVTGIAHMLEHMMFKGTENLAPGEFSTLVARLGGQQNAFTSRDYTAYFQTLAADHLETVMRWEADRLANLVLDEQEFRREVEVVKEEWRMRSRDNPNARLYELLYATAFVNSGYHHPVIGWKTDIDAYTLADLEQWRHDYYAPNNAVLVVVGAVEPEQVMALAEKYYGPIAARELPAAKPRIELEQQGLRRVELELPARLPLLAMGYKVPSLPGADEDWEPYALTVLAGVLAGGESSRFSNELERAGKLAQARTSYSLTARLPTLFVLTGVPNQDGDTAEVEALLREQIERVRREPIPAAELERVKTQVVARDVYERDSMFYQGMRIGIYEAIGLDHRRLAEYVPRIEAVTPEQVQKVARKYLTEQALTIAELKPLPLAPGSPPAAAPYDNGGTDRVH
ncbi:M16 family metallopeptidase [Desulfurivibrio sp. C05AmB]|uniref:M16 family metallopeptidase n=1 Tax=Desulfurivibrio sp. C05AmB TaxID=3374371 RepID=UPI00376EC84D